MSIQSSTPPYFQWIIDKRLAICAHPFHASHIRYLLEQRIHTVISITDSYRSDIPNQSRADLHVQTYHVPEGGAPTMQQCQQFVHRMDVAQHREEGIVVECTRGKGSAGVLIGCYLLALWKAPPDYIVNHLRLIRPITLETPLQEQQIMDYHNTIASTQRHFYAEVDRPHSWDIDTNYLNTTPLVTPQQLSLA
ncbi:unnamed protein product [Rotaria socialis]|uniref:Tyrosine specific protein phosphatases domain-containing protein n=2 Tax=Rotaria socialis TaxID=392032 RepID=A0A820I425_9BILA|nr:unnamed protein product [Rotaria socialis]CAF3275918.1 unnamed protein product [Rotaria socialis]CAF3492162.1 unnamed protein product [Rotaria socialis]CAF4301194.1 unnamed protein product [Rotaria socialis]CAF4958369.1 unnamed protein product [Rotaria socialis]